MRSWDGLSIREPSGWAPGASGGQDWPGVTFGQTTLLKLDRLQQGSSPERVQVIVRRGQLWSGGSPAQGSRCAARKAARSSSEIRTREPKRRRAAHRPRSSGVWCARRPSIARPLARLSEGAPVGEMLEVIDRPATSGLSQGVLCGSRAVATPGSLESGEAEGRSRELRTRARWGWVCRGYGRRVVS